jgi:hypothetical protein
MDTDCGTINQLRVVEHAVSQDSLARFLLIYLFIYLFIILALVLKPLIIRVTQSVARFLSFLKAPLPAFASTHSTWFCKKSPLQQCIYV